MTVFLKRKFWSISLVFTDQVFLCNQKFKTFCVFCSALRLRSLHAIYEVSVVTSRTGVIRLRLNTLNPGGYCCDNWKYKGCILQKLGISGSSPSLQLISTNKSAILFSLLWTFSTYWNWHQGLACLLSLSVCPSVSVTSFFVLAILVTQTEYEFLPLVRTYLKFSRFCSIIVKN